MRTPAARLAWAAVVFAVVTAGCALDSAGAVNVVVGYQPKTINTVTAGMLLRAQGYLVARTPHELMRTVEVSFIRDCAELAARSSLIRTESRWGLYHERADLPARDDQQWGYHLNLRKASDGSMEFLKRPVAPYFVPVPGLDTVPPVDQSVRMVEQPPLVGGQSPAGTRSRVSAELPVDPPSPRIAAVLAFEEPTVADLTNFLTDADPGVRRTAVTTLTQHTPDGYAAALMDAVLSSTGG